MRKRSSACRSAPPATRAALMTFAPVRRATSVANDGPLVAVQLDVREPDRVGGAGDLVERRVHEHADELDPAAHAARDPGRDRLLDGAREPRPEDEAERPGAQRRRQLGVLEARDAADLDPGHRVHRRRQPSGTEAGRSDELDLHGQAAAVARAARPGCRRRAGGGRRRRRRRPSSAPGVAVDGEDHVAAGHAAVARGSPRAPPGPSGSTSRTRTPARAGAERDERVRRRRRPRSRGRRG